MNLKQLYKNISDFSWRTAECAARYEVAMREKQLKPLLDEPRIKEWNYWAIIENSYPYDALFEVHHMLIPKRVVARKHLTRAERDELEIIVEEIKQDYDRQIINFPSQQSINSHFHIHLVSGNK